MVDTYICDADGVMDESEFGEWIKECDYNTLKAQLTKMTKERDEWETMFSNVAHAVNTTAGLDDSYGWDESIEKIKERFENTKHAHDKNGKRIAQLEDELVNTEQQRKYTLTAVLKWIRTWKSLTDHDKRAIEKIFNVPVECEHGVININETVCAYGCHDAKEENDGQA